jgi:hypothetical protein
VIRTAILAFPAANIVVVTGNIAYIYTGKECWGVHRNREPQVSDVVETIRRRMERSEDLAEVAGNTAIISETQPVGASPSCINHARFAAMSARLAQVSAKASADCLAQPARAHDPMHTEHVLRFLTDVRRIADAIAAYATGA